MDSGPEGEPQGRQGSLELAGLTDTGRARSVNEDSWTRADIGAVTLIVVADGMGGHQAGEVASGLAVQQIPKAYAEAAGDPPARLARAFEVANRAVHEHSRRRPDARGMGTTVTAAVLDGPNLVIGHAGDSRAYLWREGALRQLTRDHSWVAERVRSGVLSEEEARTHRWRSVITNALGSFPRVRLDLFGLTLQAGDTLLLCSDGLDAVLNDEEIAAVLERTAPQPAENAARELVRLANEGGGPDNITVALAQVRETGEASGHYPLPVLDESSEPRSLDPEPDARGTLVLEPPRRSSRRRTAALAVSAVALAALAA